MIASITATDRAAIVSICLWQIHITCAANLETYRRKAGSFIRRSTSTFELAADKSDYYLTASRMVPIKGST